ncbi:MAG: 1-acyl-sn-glycerol-3-phosphate acyltransferase [Flavobacteriales bacterium]|nr:1-acyl-sn-glycerol-3-phosphate acyltransferase [Flavobacteriales bacterium]
MWKHLSRIAFSLFGWTMDKDIPNDVNRCVIIAAPHTSNWDLFYARLAFYLMDIPLRFTIKQEWLRFPFGPLTRAFGGIGIDRRPKVEGDPRKSMTEAMTDLFAKHQQLAMMVTPEGTRGLRTEWKTGFYYVALNAGVPIALGYLDYDRKRAGVGPIIHPTGDIDSDMRKIMAFYRNIAPKHRERFSLDERYV